MLDVDGLVADVALLLGIVEIDLDVGGGGGVDGSGGRVGGGGMGVGAVDGGEGSVVAVWGSVTGVCHSNGVTVTA